MSSRSPRAGSGAFRTLYVTSLKKSYSSLAGMDAEMDLPAQPSRAGVRRLFDLPVEEAGRCTVLIQAGVPGRCAVCTGRYDAGEWIGHSRDAGGWVASCCL